MGLLPTQFRGQIRPNGIFAEDAAVPNPPSLEHRVDGDAVEDTAPGQRFDSVAETVRWPRFMQSPVRGTADTT